MYILFGYLLKKLLTFKSRAKDNNLNSKLITVELLSKDGFIQLDKYNYNTTFDKPITVIYDYLSVSSVFVVELTALVFLTFFLYIKNFNISDTRCVYLNELNDK